MTMTKQRTAKITKPYEPAALYRVYEKESGACLGYVAPSEDGKAFHQIHCDDNARWHCTCDGNAKWNRECKHIKAVQEICAIRVAAGRPGCFESKKHAELIAEVVEQAESLNVGDVVQVPASLSYEGTMGIVAGQVYADPMDREPVRLVKVDEGAHVVMAVKDLKPATSKAIARGSDVRSDLYGQPFSLRR